jgi:hypothetical protein
MTRPSLPEAMSRRTKRADGCWTWTGNVCSTTGYGRLGFNGALLSAHRVAYELEHGAIPDGLVIDHLCRVRTCVNPAHLESVTIRENTLRGEGPTARRAKATACERGHAFDAANTIMQRGYRLCRTCRDARDAANNAKRRVA